MAEGGDGQLLRFHAALARGSVGVAGVADVPPLASPSESLDPGSLRPSGRPSRRPRLHHDGLLPPLLSRILHFGPIPDPRAFPFLSDSSQIRIYPPPKDSQVSVKIHFNIFRKTMLRTPSRLN